MEKHGDIIESLRRRVNEKKEYTDNEQETLKGKFIKQFSKSLKKMKVTSHSHKDLDWDFEDNDDPFVTLYTKKGKDFFEYRGGKWEFRGSKEW